jgi:hypothetical protein
MTIEVSMAKPVAVVAGAGPGMVHPSYIEKW